MIAYGSQIKELMSSEIKKKKGYYNLKYVTTL